MGDAKFEKLIDAAMDCVGASSRSDDDHQPRESPAEPTGDVDGALPSFPRIAWRGIFADYRAAMEGTTEATDVAHFAAVWAGIAVSLGRRVRMYAGEDLYPNVYLAIFGPSNDKKTTAMRRLLNLSLLDPETRVIRSIGSTARLRRKLSGEQ